MTETKKEGSGRITYHYGFYSAMKVLYGLMGANLTF